MPRIYRVMKPDEDGKPKVGTASICLGIRVPPERDGITLVEGQIEPGTGGLSVRPSLQTIPVAMVSEELQAIVPGASGGKNHHVWQMGEGPFENAPVADNLTLRPDSRYHGLLEPSVTMLFEDFQNALAATRDSWSDVEAEK